MPENRTLRSVSVSEIIEQLGANILCRPENIDLGKVMVEELKIGAMDVNSAQSYFRKSYNKAVITGSSRIDLQFAALETSTNCLILTGRPFISDDVAHKAMELGALGGKCCGSGGGGYMIFLADEKQHGYLKENLGIRWVDHGGIDWTGVVVREL
jgi:hypothetical protein